MAAPKAPVLGGTKEVPLDEVVFAAEIKPHLVHEAVRAEMNAARSLPRDFSVKVNKKAMRAALRAALSDHAQAETIGLVSADSFDKPSTKQAVELLAKWGQQTPTVVVVNEDEESLIKSFRNLEKVLITVPAELEVAQVVWARSLLVSEAALPLVNVKAGVSA